MAVSAEELKVATELRMSINRLNRLLRTGRPTDGPSVSKVSLLGCLYHRGPMAPGELAEHERLQPQSLTRMLASLEEEKLIFRRQDPSDHRRFIIEITGAGMNLLRREMARRDASLAKAIAEKLSTTERDLLRLGAQLLNRLTESSTAQR
jgi:DNA-binding MarR family transcriptional regulator